MAKVGRPRRDPSGKPSRLYPVRLTDSEIADYERSAKLAEMTVAQWIRDRLGKAVKRETKNE